MKLKKTKTKKKKPIQYHHKITTALVTKLKSKQTRETSKNV